MRFVLTVPAIQANAMLLYAAGRAIISKFAPKRLEVPEADWAPRLVGHALLAAAIMAYEH